MEVRYGNAKLCMGQVKIFLPDLNWFLPYNPSRLPLSKTRLTQRILNFHVNSGCT